MIPNILQLIANGTIIGSIYVLICLGLTLVFGALKIPNFAQGIPFMLGAYIAWFLVAILGIDWISGVILGTLAVFIIALLIEKMTISPIYKASNRDLAIVLSTLGLGMFVEQLITILRPPYRFESIPTPGFLKSSLYLPGDVIISEFRIVILVISITVMLGLYFFLHRTMLGFAIRAVAQDVTGTSLQGINTSRIYTLIFGLGAALSAVAGIFYGSVYNLWPTMGFEATLIAFCVVVVGGIGSIRGTILVAFALGLTEEILVPWIFPNEAKMLIRFVWLIAILIVKPSGVFGERKH